MKWSQVGHNYLATYLVIAIHFSLKIYFLQYSEYFVVSDNKAVAINFVDMLESKFSTKVQMILSTVKTKCLPITQTK
jgi:hypothetical protein